MRMPLNVRALSNQLLTYCTKTEAARVVFLCLLFDEIEPFSKAAAGNNFSKDYHTLVVSEDLRALLLLHPRAGQDMCNALDPSAV